MTVQTHLDTHPFLKGLSPQQLRALASCATEMKIEKDQFVVKEGAPADTSYLVLKGKVALEVYVASKGGVPVETVESGGVIGWSWLMSDNSWHFDARAVEDTELIALDGKRVRALCQENPMLGYDLLKRFMPVIQHRLESLRWHLLEQFAGTTITR